jgi:hypothetical protein
LKLHRLIQFVCFASTTALVALNATAQPVWLTGDLGWHISAVVAEESIGQGLPVLALDQADWPRYLPNPVTQGRAFRSLKAELGASHKSGWRVAAVTRTQAWLDASPDAVRMAALEAQGANPTGASHFQVNAKSESWQGSGVTLGTPWWPLDLAGVWQWQADLTWLKLQQLRLADASGTVTYRGAGGYDFDLRSQRSNLDVTGRFLAPSGDIGAGASLSLAVQGQPLPGWRLALRADDVLSKLHWDDLATDSNALQSQNTSRAPDGTLNYAALLNGKKELLPIATQIGPQWHAELGWAIQKDQVLGRELTLKLSRQAGINQHWMGWKSGCGQCAAPQWHVEFEPSWKAARMEVRWMHWTALLATDGKGMAAQLRQFKMGWQLAF